MAWNAGTDRKVLLGLQLGSMKGRLYLQMEEAIIY